VALCLVWLASLVKRKQRSKYCFLFIRKGKRGCFIFIITTSKHLVLASCLFFLFSFYLQPLLLNFMLTSSSFQPSRPGDSLVLGNTGIGLIRDGLPVETTQQSDKYNRVIASAMRYNHDVNFTPSSPRVLATIYYMTNYATKAQVDRGQLVLAAAMLKKAQEMAEAAAAGDSDLSAPEPLDMSKFALKAYNCFTRDVEVGTPAVAYFLLGQPSAYIPKSDKSVAINFYWVKTNIRRVLNSLLDKSTDEDVAESADQYMNFDGRTRCTSIYENYEHRGARLAHPASTNTPPRSLCRHSKARRIGCSSFHSTLLTPYTRLISRSLSAPFLSRTNMRKVGSERWLIENARR
jgi:hypothetical protein